MFKWVEGVDLQIFLELLLEEGVLWRWSIVLFVLSIRAHGDDDDEVGFILVLMQLLELGVEALVFDSSV